MKQISLITLSILAFAVGTVKTAYAQSSWQECPDGTQITRCETYDCPQGDTNRDGACTLEDQGAKYADAKNNAFCANPISGCGEVRYFAQDSTTACAIRVKENNNNCNLYNAGKPNFESPTPRPTSTPRPSGFNGTSGGATSSPSPSSSTSPSPSSSTTKGGQVSTESADTLPETGPSFMQTIFLVAMGFTGLYIYEKYKFAG